MGSLQIEQSLRFERHIWLIQRISWVCMLLIVLAALLGFFGHGGPFSEESVSGQGLTVHYSRFLRQGEATRFLIRAGEPLDPRNLSLDPQWAEQFDTQSLTASGGTVTLQGQYQQRVIGSQTVRIGRTGGGSVNFQQFIYP